VVAVAVDDHPLFGRSGLGPETGDDQTILDLGDLDTQLAQLARHRRQPIGFLESEVRDISNPGGPPSKRRQGRQRRHLVGHRREVQVDSRQARTGRDSDAFGLPLDLGTHPAEDLEKASVTLA
jgi:hypothetical protein